MLRHSNTSYYFIYFFTANTNIISKVNVFNITCPVNLVPKSNAPTCP
uniref:Uncharacterized protein n=2 Tax=unclassified Caudoviricetes TaxID=2788787 RepID=A0A8S5NPN9_9CAUD|nr:MAG TPA: hypothetical protein [Myoviridae sp. ctSGm32]DAD99004.1 MAG TPA: hypothetical protein [Myoviridae sp. ctjs85]